MSLYVCICVCVCVCVCVCLCLFVAEISNLLVVTKERAPAPQTPIQDSQLSFIRILKEEIEQVQPSHLHVCFPCYDGNAVLMMPL